MHEGALTSIPFFFVSVMSQELKAAYENQLRQMTPFATMSDDRSRAVIDQGRFMQISEGHLLFKRSTDNVTSAFSTQRAIEPSQ